MIPRGLCVIFQTWMVILLLFSCCRYVCCHAQRHPDSCGEWNHWGADGLEGSILWVPRLQTFDQGVLQKRSQVDHCSETHHGGWAVWPGEAHFRGFRPVRSGPTTSLRLFTSPLNFLPWALFLFVCRNRLHFILVASVWIGVFLHPSGLPHTDRGRQAQVGCPGQVRDHRTRALLWCCRLYPSWEGPFCPEESGRTPLRSEFIWPFSQDHSCQLFHLRLQTTQESSGWDVIWPQTTRSTSSHSRIRTPCTSMLLSTSSAPGWCCPILTAPVARYSQTGLDQDVALCWRNMVELTDGSMIHRCPFPAGGHVQEGRLDGGETSDALDSRWWELQLKLLWLKEEHWNCILKAETSRALTEKLKGAKHSSKTAKLNRKLSTNQQKTLEDLLYFIYFVLTFGCSFPQRSPQQTTGNLHND